MPKTKHRTIHRKKGNGRSKHAGRRSEIASQSKAGCFIGRDSAFAEDPVPPPIRLVVRQIKEGFPFSRLIRFERSSGLPREKISRFVSIPIRTLTRRQSEGKLHPDESDRLLRISRIFDLAVELFEGDVSAAREWLQAPQSGLGGEVPLEFASTEVGAREVENLIGRLEYGVIG